MIEMEDKDLIKLGLETGLGESPIAYRAAAEHLYNNREASAAPPPSEAATDADDREYLPNDEEVMVVPGDASTEAIQYTCVGIPNGLKSRLNTTKVLRPYQATNMLGEIVTAIRKNQDVNRVCYAHLLKMGAKIGLQVRMLSERDLTERLQRVWRERGRLYQLKTERDTCQCHQPPAVLPRVPLSALQTIIRLWEP